VGCGIVGGGEIRIDIEIDVVGRGRDAMGCDGMERDEMGDYTMIMTNAKCTLLFSFWRHARVTKSGESPAWSVHAGRDMTTRMRQRHTKVMQKAQ